MPTLLTTDEVQRYLKGELSYPYHKEAVERFEALAVHFNGKYPKKIIEERRPHEGDTVKNYRKVIWEPITQEDCGKILTELNKIRRADDWSISYQGKEQPASIKTGESLRDYCDLNMPVYRSATNWLFGVALKAYAIDANAVIINMPIEFAVDTTEYLKPIPYIFHADRVLVYYEDDFTIVKSVKKEKRSKDFLGSVYYHVNTSVAEKWVENEDRSYTIVAVWEHNLGYLPARLTGGICSDSEGGAVLYNSRLHYIVPRLNEAAREYSDLQAAVVQHQFPEKWVMASQKCTACDGIGKTRKQEGQGFDDCSTCRGKGTVTNPYEFHVVFPKKNATDPEPITPPAGYIEKPVEIIKIQDDRVEKHKYKALSAINMQFLHRVPLAESGISKEVDRDSLNTFVHSVGEDLVSILDWYYRTTTDIRYRNVIESEAERIKMIPDINVPQNLDLLSAGYILEEIKNAKSSGVNPILIAALQADYSQKRFATNPVTRDLLSAQFELDPFPGVSEEDKMSRLSNNGITRDDYILSSNIQLLVAQAFDIYGMEFFKFDLKKKKEVISKLAEAIIKNIDPVNKVIV